MQPWQFQQQQHQQQHQQQQQQMHQQQQLWHQQQQQQHHHLHQQQQQQQQFMMHQQHQQQQQFWHQQQNFNPAEMPVGEGGELIDRMGAAVVNRLHNMKRSYTLFQDFIKLMVAYHQSLASQSMTGKQAASILQKISTGVGQPDIAEGLKQLSEMQGGADGRLQQVSQCLFNDLIRPAQSVLTGGYKETLRFEQGFQQGFANAKIELYQCGMSPMRQQKLQEVEDKVANNLQILKGLERKVYLNFLLLWSAFLDSHTNYLKTASKTYLDLQAKWNDLAVSSATIAKEPVEFKELISQKRGFSLDSFPTTPENPQSPRGGPPPKPGAAGPGPAAGAGGLQAVQGPGGSVLLVSDWSASGGQIPRVVATSGEPPSKPISALREEMQQQYKAMPKFPEIVEREAEQWRLAAPKAPMMPEVLRSGTFKPQSKGNINPAASKAPAAPGRSSAVLNSAAGPDGKLPKYKALYPYQKNHDDELSFPAGAIIVIVSKDAVNWWTGIYNGQTALAPSNYLTAID